METVSWDTQAPEYGAASSLGSASRSLCSGRPGHQGWGPPRLPATHSTVTAWVWAAFGDLRDVLWRCPSLLP